jgi:hypothetical protein
LNFEIKETFKIQATFKTSSTHKRNQFRPSGLMDLLSGLTEQDF